ncbi:hypothetical protein NOCARDAX2BIS_90146 [Nocardioides sp. AX2bis]|nr:hypothetical protein NOCARDAX2BIS_90146 [Nocardioides sp. AX2bis]
MAPPFAYALVGSLALLGLVYALWAGYLALWADEGSVPPRSRLPDIPSGAHVVSETEPCASGGCWREVVVRPAPGQSPHELAAEMGVADADRYPWLLLDPHSVEVGSRVRGDELSIYVQY